MLLMASYKQKVPFNYRNNIFAKFYMFVNKQLNKTKYTNFNINTLNNVKT